MALPFIVSPWVRPLRVGGEVRYDNPVTGETVVPGPLAARVVQALWDPAGADERLEAIVEEYGLDEVGGAMATLLAAAVLFPDRRAAERALARTLEAGRSSLPFVDQIELTNHCPMNCAFCPRGVDGLMQRPKGTMDFELFERLLAQMHPDQARYRPLELHHLGESLLHPRVVDFVAAASARGLPTEMSVNPSHLEPKLARGLLDAGLRRLVVSLDGLDAATLAAIRGPAARWDRAERNLASLLELVASLADPPSIVIQMIDLHGNRGQHEAFLARWATTGLPTVRAYIKDLDGPDPETGAPSAHPVRMLCGYPWRSVVVLWDGRVVPCCRDDDARLVLGSLADQTLEAIWHGAPARALREAHASRSVPGGHLCHEGAWSIPAFADAMAERHPDHAREEPLRW